MVEILFEYSNEQADIEISDEMLALMKKCCESVLKTEGLEGKFEVSLTVVDETAIKQINSEFRNIDKVTDVLSFPMSDDKEFPENFDTGAKLLGDIVICAKRAREQAEEYGHSEEREFGFLCTHSVLHLLGYDHVNDEEERKLMQLREKESLEAIEFRRE